MPTINKRPISPHLQIYNIFSKEMTSGPSIIHRLTGIALGISVIYLIAGLLCASLGEAAYIKYIVFMSSWFGLLSLFGISVCFFFHVTNAVRFSLFGFGYLLTKKQVMVSGWLVVTLTLIFTVCTWLYIIFSLQ